MDRGSETRLEVAENLNKLTQQDEAYSLHSVGGLCLWIHIVGAQAHNVALRHVFPYKRDGLICLQCKQAASFMSSVPRRLVKTEVFFPILKLEVLSAIPVSEIIKT